MITTYKGNISFVFKDKIQVDPMVPQPYIQKQIERDGEIHHITLILKNEISNDINETLSQIKSTNGIEQLEIIGTGRVKRDDGDEVYFGIVFWPIGNKIRRELNLPHKDFHVTLGFKHKDVHDVNKGLNTLIPQTLRAGIIPHINDIYTAVIKDLDDIIRREFIKVLNVISVISDIDPTALLILRSKLYYGIKEYDSCLEDCLSVSTCAPSDVDNRLRIAHIHYLQDRIYQALSIYRQILEVDDNPKATYGIQQCNSKLLGTVDPREKHVVNMPDGNNITLSRNFSWVIPGKLAGISLPKRKEEIEAFKFMNIGLVVSVIEEATLDPKWFDDDIKNIHYDVVNYHPPTMDDLLDIIERMENMIRLGKGVIVNCGGAVGRAGTVLTCYMLKNGLTGEIKENTHPAMSSSDAIAKIRELRPKSIETERQENFIKEYCDYLWKNMK